MARIIAISNQKGGVGKTTSIVNIASSMALLGQRVLVIDFDPQANASSSLGVFPSSELTSVSAALMEESPIEVCIHETGIKRLDLVPSTQSLSGIEIEMVNMTDREYRLSHALNHVIDEYDYILIDTPPTLGLLTVNALTSAESVLIPLQPEYLALEGLSQFLEIISSVRKALNPALQLEGILLTMYDKRNSLARQVEEDVKSHFPDDVFESIIPRNTKLSEAPSHAKPIMCYDFRSKGSQAYVSLTKEILAMHNQKIPSKVSRRDVNKVVREFREGV